MVTPEPGGTNPPPGLPLQLTRFVGRARELDDLLGLLPMARLLTLTGAGGSGKTRLAYEAASRTNGWFETVAWVDLAPVQDPALIPQLIALALKLAEPPGATSLELITSAVGRRRILLVIDNCEHLVDVCAGIVETLLRDCPGLVVVATSREALGVMGETAWLVPPLSAGEAVQLFVERACSVQPGFALTPANAPAITEICRRLDGLPLAIELAAARVRVLPPEQIAERLSDAFKLLSAHSRSALPRHRTLRGTMDWSYALLSEREQILLRRLGVFAASFSLGAAEAICAGPGISAEEVLDSITTLVDKSLVVLSPTEGEARYLLLETVRQYGDELLQAAGERDELRLLHAEFYLALAEHAAPRLFGGAVDRRLVSALTEETGNLRAVSNWAMEDPARFEKALRLGTALHWFWFAKGRFEEGRKRLTAALSLGTQAAPGVRAWALIALGHIHVWQGNPQAGLPLMQEALILEQELDDPEGLAYALNGVGACINLGGDAERCQQYFAEALPIAARVTNRTLHAIVLYYHGRAAQDRGENQMAREAFETATRIGRTTNSTPAIAHPLVMEGRLAYMEGRLADALVCYHESLTIHNENDDAWGTVLCLEGISYVAAARGQLVPSVRLMAQAETMRLRISAPMWPTDVAEHERVKQMLREQLSGFDAAWTEGARLEQAALVQLGLELSAPGPAESPQPVREVIAVEASPAVPDLQVRALGPLQVFRQGERIEASAWGSARPRELLVFLLMHPDGCTKEQVGVAFWPEASAAQVRNSFHVTLHRLRKALGRPDWVVTGNERYRLDPTLRIEFDVAAFEAEMQSALKKSSEDELAAALGRYAGDFLNGESAGDWHLEYRERLQRLYVDGLCALSVRLLDRGRLLEAADACRRVLARDEMHEEAWRRLMLCHARSGERAQALRVYQQLADLLQREFETEPDPSTTALYQEVMAGNQV